jgi:hypothetical protein
MILKLLSLPFYFIALGSVLIFPVSMVLAFLEGEPRGMFGSLMFLGSIPFLLMQLHLARMEHFMLKRMRKSAQATNLASDVQSSIVRGYASFLAHYHLITLLESQKHMIDDDTFEAGRRIANRHRALAKLSLVGVGVIVIGVVGFGYMSKNV